MRPVPEATLDTAHPSARPSHATRQWDVLISVSIGGVAGAEARYGLARLVAHPEVAFPWSTFVINVTGCLLIGALMAVLLDLTAPHRLARPFLGVGVLGGYTTFSTFTVDTVRLVDAHRPLVAAGYVVATAVLCVLAVAVGSAATRLLGRAAVERRARRHAGAGVNVDTSSTERSAR